MTHRGCHRPRDERGWRVPRSGTKSRAIYDMVLEGRTTPEIALALGISRSSVGVLKHRMRYPEHANATALHQYRAALENAR